MKETMQNDSHTTTGTNGPGELGRQFERWLQQTVLQAACAPHGVPQHNDCFQFLNALTPPYLGRYRSEGQFESSCPCAEVVATRNTNP